MGGEMDRIAALPTQLEKYTALAELQARDPNAYYRALIEDTTTVMPLVYTPTVGAACQQYSTLAKNNKHMQSAGLFLQLGRDTGKIAERLAEWPSKNIKAIVVTDGERILGLGDLGSDGMGIPVGKMALYAGLGGIDYEACLPVTLDVGTNTASVSANSDYLGLKKSRGKPGTPEHAAYLDFVAEFVDAVRSTYGKNTLIQWEDFGNANAFNILEKYRGQCCCFNDDIQGTASVALAGILASKRIHGRNISDETVLFQGAGEAGCGIAELLAVAAANEKGCTVAEARKRIFLCDSRGLVYAGRPTGGIVHHKAPFAHEGDFSECTDLLAAVRRIKPTVLIGVSAQPGTFTEEIIGEVAKHCARPCIFPLSNPTHKAECTAEQAYKWTGGNAIVATGSPFDAVDLGDGKGVKVPGQGNNVYIFPGVGLGVKLLADISTDQIYVDDQDMLDAARACAALVSEDQVSTGCVYPKLSELRLVAASIAAGFVNRRIPGAVTTDDCISRMYSPDK